MTRIRGGHSVRLPEGIATEDQVIRNGLCPFLLGREGWLPSPFFPKYPVTGSLMYRTLLRDRAAKAVFKIGLLSAATGTFIAKAGFCLHLLGMLCHSTGAGSPRK